METGMSLMTQRLEELWRRHVDRLLLYATATLSERSAAEDVLQTVFVRLLSLRAFPESGSEATYLYRAVRNEALTQLRTRRRSKKALESMIEAPSEDPREAAELRDLGRKIESTLLDLPAEEREAVVLKIWADLSFPEASSVMGVSEKTFEHRYYRGLETMKERLGVQHE
jgi:RNA polymerase sigma factor (sigma-70 family)